MPNPNAELKAAIENAFHTCDSYLATFEQYRDMVKTLPKLTNLYEKLTLTT